MCEQEEVFKKNLFILAFSLADQQEWEKEKKRRGKGKIAKNDDG